MCSPVETSAMSSSTTNHQQIKPGTTMTPAITIVSTEHTRCTECNGTGTAQCKRCAGAGHHKCFECREARDDSESHLDLYCEDCGGSGVFACDRCSASGLLECRICDGTGQLNRRGEPVSPMLVKAVEPSTLLVDSKTLDGVMLPLRSSNPQAHVSKLPS